MIRWLKGLVLAGTVGLLAACGGGDENDPDLMAELRSDPQFSLLTEAVESAGLAGTLSGPGPLTVFAPTNAAFAALLTELGVTKDQLFADRTLLNTVLTYHVLPSRVERAVVPLGLAVTTVQGGIFKVDQRNGALVITDGRNRTATITATDRMLRNGLIHTIDRVLLPANLDIVQTAQALPQFSILVDAVVAAGLVDALKAPGPLTVFAPTNDAFAALLAELGVTADQLLADTPLLTQVLTYHVVAGRVLATGIVPGAPVTTLQGATFTVGADLRITDGRLRSAGIVATDVLTSNGVVHVIDRVILPPQ